MSARVRAALACLAVAGMLVGGAGAYAATGGSKTKPPAKSHKMNGTKSSANCPNM